MQLEMKQYLQMFKEVSITQHSVARANVAAYVPTRRVKTQVRGWSARQLSKIPIETAWLNVLPYKGCASAHAFLDNKIGWLQK